MQPATQRSRKPGELSDSLLRRLNGYAVAAGAAGVGLMAVCSAAQAEVVYTPANVTISLFQNQLYSLNPAGAQVAPFLLAANFTSPGNAGYWDALSFNPRSSGAGFVKGPGSSSSIAPLDRGAEIGSKRTFGNGNRGFIATFGPYGGGTYNNHDGFKFGQAVYIGFKFQISGQTHYGWARVLVRFNPNFHKHELSMHLFGYAYETTPNQSIKAGQTAGPVSLNDMGASTSAQPVNSAPVPHQSLGLLALGAEGMPAWRKQSL
jgi:hypothetical protein